MLPAADLPLDLSSGSLFLRQPIVGKTINEVATQLGQYFSPNVLRVLGSADDFRPDLLTARVGSMQVSTLAYNADVELKVQPSDDHLLVTTQFRGQQQVWSQGEVDCGRVGFVAVDSTPAEITKRFSADSRRLNLRLSRASLYAMWQQATGSTRQVPQTFAPFIATAAARRRWWSHMQLLLSYIEVPPSGPYGIQMRRQIEEGILLFLLFEQPHDARQFIDANFPPDSPADRRLRKAEDYIRANLHLPLTLSDIALAAHTSIRTLTADFRTRYDTSPMKFAENLRLDAAYRALEHGVRSVTDVAAEVGFTNMGRFAVAYCRRFGVLPSRTARR